MQPLCFGGSFDPIHHGHLIGARAVAEQLGATRVIIVPSGKPPHKQDRNELAPAADRAQMCRLAVIGEPLFEVNDIEVQLPGPSYTLDTVRELHRLGYGRVRWLIGSDMLMYLPQWHRAEDLVNEVDFVVMARPGWDLEWDRLPAAFRHLRQSVVEAPRVDISSTDIRRRVAEGASIQYLTPPVVAQYIHDRGLYR